jgi:hypothetical protein
VLEPNGLQDSQQLSLFHRRTFLDHYLGNAFAGVKSQLHLADIHVAIEHQFVLVFLLVL